MISSAAEYDQENPQGTLGDYLGIISLVSDADHLKGAGGAITLMTLHAAKGLEFPVVAMIGLEDGILPHSRARESQVELEEERRLCFVGITRAQERLILSKAAVRTIRGLRERTATSPFLAELSAEDLRVIDRTGTADLTRYNRPTDEQSLAARFKQGQRVKHPHFGAGRIAEMSSGGTNARVIVEFERAGRKTLVLEYAAPRADPLNPRQRNTRPNQSRDRDGPEGVAGHSARRNHVVTRTDPRDRQRSPNACPKQSRDREGAVESINPRLWQPTTRSSAPRPATNPSPRTPTSSVESRP